jgi:hypothetical protein
MTCYEHFIRSRDLWTILQARISGSRLKVTRLNQEAGDKFAVIATFGKTRATPDPDIERLIDACHRRGFNIVFVHNGPIGRDYLARVSSKIHVLLERPNVGKDFGGFKDAVGFLQKRKTPPKRVIFANDSNFLTPAGLEEMIARLDDDRHALIGVTECHEFAYHIGSFLYSINDKVFTSKAFRTFWRKYFPYSTRRHTVLRGEIMMSQYMIGYGGFVPHVIYSASEIGQVLRKWTPQEMRENFYLMSRQIREAVTQGGLLEIFDERVMMIETSGSQTNQRSSSEQRSARLIAAQRLSDALVRIVERGNQIHTAGGLFARYLGMPVIKKDLAYRNVETMTDMIMLLECLKYPDMEHVQSDLRRRGSHVTLKGYRRKLYDHGYI